MPAIPYLIRRYTAGPILCTQARRLIDSTLYTQSELLSPCPSRIEKYVSLLDFLVSFTLNLSCLLVVS